MNIFLALLKREFLDGKNGYIRVPVILAAVTVGLVLLSAAGFGNVIHINDMEREGFDNLASMLVKAGEHEPEELPAAMTVAYWSMSLLTWIAFPFVVFFSLLGSLYEERRDRSVLFWKSMPVADWQEVVAKLVAPVLVAPAIFLGVAIAAQLVIAALLSIVVLFQGGPVMDLWPLGLMITSWFGAVGNYVIWALWALPVLAWVLFVSSYANRMPFMWALLPPVVLVIIELMFRDTSELGLWILVHLGGWQDQAFSHLSVNIDGPRDLFRVLFGGMHLDAIKYTLSSLHFWAGLMVAGGFVYGAIQMRKRAI